jgi:hypothetical protein
VTSLGKMPPVRIAKTLYKKVLTFILTIRFDFNSDDEYGLRRGWSTSTHFEPEVLE